MRILLLCNNWVGWQIGKWLRDQNEDIAGLVLHPPDNRRYGDEILDSIGMNPDSVYDGSCLQESEVFKAIEELQFDIGLSIYFGYILTPEFINLFPDGVINLHPAYLPFNRGAYPNVWSIVEDTPAGVTIHYIDPGIDTGDIIARCQISTEPVDTGESLYRKLEYGSIDLFKETWPKIRSGNAPRFPQGKNEGTFHHASDVKKIDQIDLDSKYMASEMINIIRARTFPPYQGAYFVSKGRKIYLQLHLLYEDGLEVKK